MSDGLAFAIVCGFLALIYGNWATRSVMSESAGNERMQEIAAAVQEGAKAYLNRQYLTIGAVGVVIFIILLLLFNLSVGLAFLVGAVLSGAAGYIGMNVSVRANVRTADGRDASWIRDDTIVVRGKTRIGIIGISTPETATSTLPANVRGLRFADPAPVIDERARSLRSRGADVIVVVAHEGGFCNASAGSANAS